ncbi:hypothetical protein [Prochlorococcus sp. MIT 1223]|uniref:hypothetical protein n=1 Tax=Prochlorococcus sp. MIT 1223 TaxID=3096217 RepID=UPI002A7546F1|nr:hypothetical protein [Prochlorococcus sp. MIT 1223]
MKNQESPEERKLRFKAMSSKERKKLIREKMEVEALQEGSGILGKNISSYDRSEILDLIQLTSCFPELQIKQSYEP